MSRKLASCCQDPTLCCPKGQTSKVLEVEFLYLDLNSCQRCRGSDRHLDEALEIISPVLKAIDVEIHVHRIKIDTVEMAMRHRFLSSPTFRVNGRDFSEAIEESDCLECGDICKTQVDCRVWTYRGKTTTEMPKAFIIDSVFSYLYGSSLEDIKPKDYHLPQNLKKFFDGKLEANPKTKEEKIWKTEL